MSGYLMALTAVFFWSINIIIASYFATTLEPFEIAFGRWFIACLILVPMAWSGPETELPPVGRQLAAGCQSGHNRHCAGQHAYLLCRTDGLSHRHGAVGRNRTDFSGYSVAYFSENADIRPADCRFADCRIRGAGNHFARRPDADCTFQIRNR